MLYLNRRSFLTDKEKWEEKGFQLYSFDDSRVTKETIGHPTWLHVGGGNIFRAFVAPLQQQLIETGEESTGIIVTTTHNMAVIDSVYRPYDNVSVAVTMHQDGRFDKKIIGNIVESVACTRSRQADWERMQAIFTAPSL